MSIEHKVMSIFIFFYCGYNFCLQKAYFDINKTYYINRFKKLMLYAILQLTKKRYHLIQVSYLIIILPLILVFV